MKQGKVNKNSLGSASGALSTWFLKADLAAALQPHMAKVKWEAVVGPQVSAVTQPESVRDRVLTVRVANSVWANELALLKDDILRRLNLAIGGAAIREIRFKGGGLNRVKDNEINIFPVYPTPEQLAEISLAHETLQKIEKQVAGIRDEKLRHKVRHSLLRAAQESVWKSSQGWSSCSQCGILKPGDKLLCELCRVGIWLK